MTKGTLKKPAKRAEENSPGRGAVFPKQPPPGLSYLALALIAAGLLVYLNSFQGVFLFDDRTAIVENPRIQRLWPLSQSLWGPEATPLAGRPVVHFTFAVNYALSGLQVWSYHAVNLTIHILAALTLFGLIRRTFRAGPFNLPADFLAFTIGLLWMIHPLQTEAVTYITQRTELLMALFFLLTLYGFVRSLDPSTANPLRWRVGAIASCALGMASKEVMFAAPLIVLIYDRSFVARSFGETFQKRRPFYVGLASTWLILIALLATGPRSGSVGLGFPDLSPIEYAQTQGKVIAHYLRLAVWPEPLVLDYGRPIIKRFTDAAPWIAPIAALLAASLWALRNRPSLGFLGAWFFLILAPTSSFVPIITEVAAERRMYLPLAAVIAFLVVTGNAALERFIRETRTRRAARLALVVAIAGTFGYLAYKRNEDYRSEPAMWSDVVQKRPDNARGHSNLGTALAHAGNVPEAVQHFREAVRLDPEYADAYRNLGTNLVVLGNLREAAENLRRAVELNPQDLDAQHNLALTLALQADVLIRQGRLEESKTNYLEALRLAPDLAGPRVNLATILVAQGKLDEAAQHYSEAVRLKPDLAEAHGGLGRVRALQGSADEAMQHYLEALRLNPNLHQARLGLAELENRIHRKDAKGAKLKN